MSADDKTKLARLDVLLLENERERGRLIGEMHALYAEMGRNAQNALKKEITEED